MSNWDDVSDEDLYILHDILGRSARAKEAKTFSEKLNKFDILYDLLKEISIDSICNISNKIADIIHQRVKESAGNQDNT